MTPIATRPKTERRSSTASDGARPCATPVHRGEHLSVLSTVAADPAVIGGGTVGYVLITYFAAREPSRHLRRSHYPHSDHHRA